MYFTQGEYAREVRRAAGTVVGAVFAAVVGLVSDTSADPNEKVLRIAIPAAVVAALYLLLTTKTMVERWPALAHLPGAYSEPKPPPPPQNVASDEATAVQGSTAGRDIHIGDNITQTPPPPTPVASGPTRAQRLRLISDEIRHLKRRFKQLEEQRKEWSSIWPGDHAPYQVLPSEKWNLYGASLNLPDGDHDVVQEAYELANDFNHEMQRGPIAMGDPEPDLDGLRSAFEAAEEVITAAKSQGGAQASTPFSRANEMQREWKSRELSAALLKIRQELVVSQRRLRRLLQRGSSKDFRGFPSAQWSSHEELVRREAPSVCVLADQAYGLVIEMREAGLEDQQRKLTSDEVELSREALTLFEQTIAAIDQGRQP